MNLICLKRCDFLTAYRFVYNLKLFFKFSNVIVADCMRSQVLTMLEKQVALATAVFENTPDIWVIFSVSPGLCWDFSRYLGCLWQWQQASLITLDLAMAKTRPCTTKIDGLHQFSKYGLPFTTVISVIRMVSKLDSQTLQLLVCIV